MPTLPITVVYEAGGKKFTPADERHQAASVRMIKSRMHAIDEPGEWRVRPVEQRDRKGQDVFKAMGVIPGAGGVRLRLWCRPGSGDSAWEFDVIPGKSFAHTPDTLQTIIERLRKNELAGHDEDAEEEVEEPVPVEEPVEQPVEEPSTDLAVPTPAQSAVIATQPNAKNLKAQLGRLHLALERAEHRQTEMTRVRTRIDDLQHQQTTLKGELDAKMHELNYAESGFQMQMDQLIEEDLADQALLQATQVLSLATEIKL